MFIRLMRHTVYLELLPANPATDPTGRAGYVPRAPVQKRRIYLSMPELQALAEHCAPWTDLVMLAGTTGLRWGEITALSAADFRRTPEGWLLAVLRSWKEGDAGTPSPNTKNGGTRTVPVPEKVRRPGARRRPSDGLLKAGRTLTAKPGLGPPGDTEVPVVPLGPCHRPRNWPHLPARRGGC